MKVFIYTLSTVFIFFFSDTHGQTIVRNCATEDILLGQMKSDPFLIKKMEDIEKHTLEFVRKNPKGSSLRAAITIPVVVHVIYDQSFPEQNISDEQIQSQIDILNQDFSATNIEVSGANLNSSAYPLGTFSGLVANTEIQFCLAKQTPTGFATTGINRKATTRTNWDTDTALKKTSLGGVDPWDRTKYLNIWICKISLSTTNLVAGYAQLPGGDPTTDGVVIDYRFVGNMGTALYPLNKGRTATHEIGHWLNLKHIWGDAACGDDLVSDTPQHNSANTGCATFPHLSTCTGTPTEMTMNYLDYTDDRCMYMFSAGQKLRMQAVLSSGAARGSIMASPGCLPPDPNSCNAPIGLNIGKVTVSGAEAIWSESANAVSYSFEYKLNSATSWSVIKVSGTLLSLSGLAASSTYNVRVKANCANGSSIYSGVINFITSAMPTCNVPASLTSKNITATSATSNWGSVANVLNYSYEYKTKAATVWTVAPAVTINSYQLTGLLPATTYNVRIKTNCNGISSAYTATASFTTLAACAGDSESNNTAATARTTLRSNTAVNGKLGTATDVDWYKFANTSSAKNIKVTLSNLTANYNLELYFGTTTLVASSQNSGITSEVINYNNGLVGTYYIKVFGINSAFDNINCYKLLGQIGSTAFRLGLTELEPINVPLENELIVHSRNTNEDVSFRVKEYPDIQIANELMVFPNPAIDEVSMVLPIGKNQRGALEIYDIAGKIRFSEKIQGNGSNLRIEINISEFQPGLYFVRFGSGEKSYNQKLIITD